MVCQVQYKINYNASNSMPKAIILNLVISNWIARETTVFCILISVLNEIKTVKNKIGWFFSKTGTTGLADKLSEKTTFLKENQLVLFTGFEDTTALEDKKGLTVFPLNRSCTLTRY